MVYQTNGSICVLNGPSPASFAYFRSFQTQILQKKCRLQLDLNFYRRNRRGAYWPLDRHRGPSGRSCLSRNRGFRIEIFYYLTSTIYHFYTFYKWAIPGLSFVFLSFQAIITIFPTNTCEKMSIEYPALGLNPQPFEHEFPPITTRPGLFFYFTYRATSLFRVGKVWNRLRQATASKTFAHLSLSARVESPNDESQ